MICIVENTLKFGRVVKSVVTVRTWSSSMSHLNGKTALDMKYELVLVYIHQEGFFKDDSDKNSRKTQK